MQAQPTGNAPLSCREHRIAQIPEVKQEEPQRPDMMTSRCQAVGDASANATSACLGRGALGGIPYGFLGLHKARKLAAGTTRR